MVLPAEKPSQGLIREVTSFIWKRIIQANMWKKTAGREGKVLLLAIILARDDGCGVGRSGQILELFWR